MTLEALMSELETDNPIFIHHIPGHVLRTGVAECWGGNPNPGWIQFCDAVEVEGVDTTEGKIVAINGTPLEDEKVYKVGHVYKAGWGREKGTDRTKIGAYVEAHPEVNPHSPGHPMNDSGLPTQTLLMGYWAHKMWAAIYDAMDADKDGHITEEELAKMDTVHDPCDSTQELAPQPLPSPGSFPSTRGRRDPQSARTILLLARLGRMAMARASPRAT